MRGIAAALLATAMVLGGCGDAGSVGSFDENPQPISPDLVAALADDDDPDAVPEVQRNFLEGCVKGFDDAIPDLDTVQRRGLLAVCGCSYDQLVGYSYQQVEGLDGDDAPSDRDELDAAAYDVFSELEDDLRAGEPELPDEVLDLIRTCIRSEAGL